MGFKVGYRYEWRGVNPQHYGFLVTGETDFLYKIIWNSGTIGEIRKKDSTFAKSIIDTTYEVIPESVKFSELVDQYYEL